jgi:hypothetical protein
MEPDAIGGFDTPSFNTKFDVRRGSPRLATAD